MVKEDRSDWVAVAPVHAGKSDDLPSVRPAQTAYQYFQKANWDHIKQQQSQRGEPTDLAHLTKLVSSTWREMSQEERQIYEDKAAEDHERFTKESILRDNAFRERQERLRQEREELVFTEGDGHTTRRARKKELKKAAKIEKKRSRDRIKKEKVKQIDNSDEDEFKSDSDFSSDGSFNSEGSSSSSSDSDDSNAQKKKKKAIVVSEAVLARRQQARLEKEVKEKYIAERQDHLRNERAEQAKKRLDFLLKQSDIFRHFGEVKEDKQKFYSNRVKASESPSKSSRRDTVLEDEDKDLAEDDHRAASYLRSQPTTLGFGKMRPYQLEGLNWMIGLQEHGVNGILADEMGLGKTLQSISVLVYMMEYQDVNGPHLVVVPKSTLSNWINEFQRWAPTLQVVKFHGNKEEREHIATNVLQPGQRDEQRTWNVCVTTYEICNLDKNVLNKFAWSYLIIDEAHRLKNEASTFSKTIRTFETRYRLLLTGTPLQNNLHELWALLNFLVPDVFANAEQFDEWFNLDIDDANEKNLLISQLHKILRPFMLRRLKVDVEKSLPPKHETILFTGMSAMQKKLYKDILMRDIDTITGTGGGGGNKTAVLNIVMQLRKCAGHPYLFPGVEDRSLPPLGEHIVENCGKMVLLDKLLKRLKELGHRVLLFTQMTRILDIIEDYLVMRQYEYCRIDGNTDYDTRESHIDAFNAPNSTKFLFLLSTRAGGLGINLQTADVVILFDSDWNPQADLQAQDRAHRIGQKKPVQIFRLVTEHTIEEKIVERAQQKLKLDAMVVQQGRLKEKDKLSQEELLAAVRFGADKVFKSKDSSITDDDIDLILEVGKKKTRELNEKLRAAEKGDMLDFKLDGGTSAQTYEGVDYSKGEFARVALQQAEMMSILDMGKRERKTVANYNEDQLYRQQLALQQGSHKPSIKKVKKEIKLPRHLRLPRLDEWQMFDRKALLLIQEEEEKAFRALPEEMQMLLKGKAPSEFKREESNNVKSESEKNSAVDSEISSSEIIQSAHKEEETEMKDDDVDQFKKPLTLQDIPALISEDRQKEKDRLLAEGFSDWGRSHYNAFIKASSKYGRHMYGKIAIEVGKTEAMVQQYANAFWDETFGKARISENEYDRVVKRIEQGEKKLDLIKVLEKATSMFVSMFDNPWRELEFTHVNMKDKNFTLEEDRHLLCWAHKYGYGQWDAVKLAMRRSPEFRFDYYLRSLTTDAIGRRCEQLMKAAEKEIEHITKKLRDEAGLGHADVDEEKKEIDQTVQITLPSFVEMKAAQRRLEEEAVESEKKQLESKVDEIEGQIEEIQKRLKFLQKCSKELEGNGKGSDQNEFPDDLLSELANLVATSESLGVMAITNEFVAQYGQPVPKKVICAKIEDIAKKERKKGDGDLRAVWHILPEYMNLLSVDTLRVLRKAKETRLEKKRGGSKKRQVDAKASKDDGAMGPDGDFVLFPEYDGKEEPRESKKAFTLFCTANRKEVKKSLDEDSRKDKAKVNHILKERWFKLSTDEQEIWKKWQDWDNLRFKRDMKIYERMQKVEKEKVLKDDVPMDSNEAYEVEKSLAGKRNESEMESVTPSNEFHIPKKKRV